MKPETATPATHRPPDPDAYPEVLRSAEKKLIDRRRSAVPPSEKTPNKPYVGVGLSGGGVRSATFCLGVFQALACAKRVRDIDYLSTVSGGGYFGSFLGRLFTRDWIGGVEDVESVLQGMDAKAPKAKPGWGDRPFRWLRDNSRYLAPRGSGDVLVLGAVLLRNWLAVQLVMIVSVLTVFLSLQIGRYGLEYCLHLNQDVSDIRGLLAGLPGGSTGWWWSPWIVLAPVPFLLLAVPAGWAYWMIAPRLPGRFHVRPVWGLLAMIGLSALATFYYGFRRTNPLHTLRLAFSALGLVTSVGALLTWNVAKLRVGTKDTSRDRDSLLRHALTLWMKRGLVFTALVLAWALLDTLGGTLYYLAIHDIGSAENSSLGRWAGGIFAGFATIGAFARHLTMLLAPTKGGGKPRVSFSILSWVGALLLVGIWLTAVNAGSHAIAWNFKAPIGSPAVSVQPPPKVLGADHLVVATGAEGITVRAADAAKADHALTPIKRPRLRFALGAFLVLLLFTWLFGYTLSFSNLSSVHAFYEAKLTRSYLAASNPARFTATAGGVQTTTAGDDAAGDEYWNWPRFNEAAAVEGQQGSEEKGIPPTVRNGGPLHIVNVTINETSDVKTGVQNQDRKGTGMAVGPSGISVGIRHHLVTDGGQVTSVPAADPDKHCVFTTGTVATTPEPLSLGRWMSVSGAAFSAAAGANTTVPIALLAGLFNVRLGYWWDSGTKQEGVRPEKLFPVQSMLWAEMFAKTRGTAGRLWNLSDGGHFENMGGYELIRRRLPLIIIIDAEADPDYTFGGLSDLIRKARLDFNAEITFLDDETLSCDTEKNTESKRVLPESVEEFFGGLDALRRGKWSDETLAFPQAEKKRFFLEVDHSCQSRAYAALAHVVYQDGRDELPKASWLVYVKASLMGGEPADVAQYHRAHPAFPQETTNDQFFDEGQWESYRRLGLHIGERVLTGDLLDYLQKNPATEYAPR